MTSGNRKDISSVDRRSFLKTAGAGIAGAALANFLPFASFTFDEAVAAAKKEGETVIPTFCGMCGPSENCGVYAFVKDGRFTKVAGMKESPVNRGGLCPKGQAAPQWVYSPDRLKYPLRRVGKKGEGKFEKITWDEAIKTIADTLKAQKEKYGPESLAMLSPARRTYSDYMQRFLIAHGSPNYGHSGICAMQRGFAFSYTLGGQPSCDYENAEVIIIWAKQPFFSGPAMDGPRTLIKAKQRGAKIISIKPSVEPDVSLADIWVPVRPGTDTALALAMLNVIINENLFDKDFTEKYCYGFDKLKEHVQKYTPEWGEKISGVPSKQIIEVSRIYAKANGAAIDLGNGVEHTPSSNDAIRAVSILMAITGNLDRKGGNLLGGGMGGGGGNMPRQRSISLASRYTPEMVDKLVGPEFPKEFQPFMEGTSSAYYRILDSVLTEKPYPIRAIIAPGTQPTVSTRGTKRVIEALKKLDFYVVVDVMRTADMNYADIVIPVATPYEIDHPFGSRGNTIVPRNRVIEPLGDYKSIFEFFLDLGVKMGYGDDFWNGSMVNCMNYQLEPLGITVDDLRKHPEGVPLQAQGGQEGAPAARTYKNYESLFKGKSTRLSGAPYLPHGKVEIYNTSFEAAGYNPLPEWREPPESITGTPELVKKYPLILSDYHTSKGYSASWQRNVPFLREVEPYPALHIHPDAASVRGIKGDDWIIVESPHGWMKVKAEIFPGIRPDTVMILHGWWQGCKELGFEDLPIADGGANVNNMYSVDPEKAYDPLITAMASQTLVQVRKA
jgi:anaerobic selenocysteine-containing dehydrogenase